MKYQTSSTHQVELADKGRIAFLAAVQNQLHVIHIADDGTTKRILEEPSPWLLPSF